MDIKKEEVVETPSEKRENPFTRMFSALKTSIGKMFPRKPKKDEHNKANSEKRYGRNRVPSNPELAMKIARNNRTKLARRHMLHKK